MARLLSEADLRQIGERVAAAERETAGEIVVSVAERSSSYARERLSVSFAVTLVLAVLVYVFMPRVPALWVLCGQAPAVVLGWWLTGGHAVIRLLVPERTLSEVVSARAKQAFVERGVTETRERSGVLLYLSEAEHRIELIADRGIHERAGAATWQATVDGILAAIGAGHPAEGLLGAIDKVGALLAQHFPRAEDDVNELPDAPFRHSGAS